MVLGNPGIASIFGVAVLETGNSCVHVSAPSADPALKLVDEADPLQIVVDGFRRRFLVLGNVLLHPGFAAILRHQDRSIAEVLERDKAVSFIEELYLPAPLPALEVLDVGGRVGPGFSAVPSAKYDRPYLAVTAQPRRGVGPFRVRWRVRAGAHVVQSTDYEPVVLVKKVNVDQVRGVFGPVAVVHPVVTGQVARRLGRGDQVVRRQGVRAVRQRHLLDRRALVLVHLQGHSHRLLHGHQFRQVLLPSTPDFHGQLGAKRGR